MTLLDAEIALYMLKDGLTEGAVARVLGVRIERIMAITNASKAAARKKAREHKARVRATERRLRWARELGATRGKRKGSDKPAPERGDATRREAV